MNGKRIKNKLYEKINKIFEKNTNYGKYLHSIMWKRYYVSYYSIPEFHTLILKEKYNIDNLFLENLKGNILNIENIEDKNYKFFFKRGYKNYTKEELNIQMMRLFNIFKELVLEVLIDNIKLKEV
jgi:hypothetical protein